MRENIIVEMMREKEERGKRENIEEDYERK